MNEVYVDWSKPPEGTTHAYTGIPAWINGVPVHHEYWEKWENGSVYEWNGSNWIFLENTKNLSSHRKCQRIQRPVSRERALIEFAATADEPRTLINYWLRGKFEKIRNEWPGCPPEALTGDAPEPIAKIDWPTEGDRCLAKD